jgi:hypothetical protein
MPVSSVGSGGPSSLLLVDADQIAAEFGGDVSARVAAMLIEHSHERREAVREMRRAEEEHLQAMEEQQVAQMREQAAHIREAAESRAIGGLVAGACRIAGGVCMMTADSEYAGRARSEMLGGGGSALESAMGLSAAADDHAAGQADADATAAGNRAEASERRLEDLRDSAADARELGSKALDLIESAKTASAEANRAALFQRV